MKNIDKNLILFNYSLKPQKNNLTNSLLIDKMCKMLLNEV
jgi:hypothetical protein